MSRFRKATKKHVRLRLALAGPAGSGKTYSALRVGSALIRNTPHNDKGIALIDTEHGSASLYSNEFDFDTLELDRYDPQFFVDALNDAKREQYPLVVIDSLSHAWSGVGGILDIKDRSKDKNSYTAWRNVTPIHNKLVETILNYPGHVIVTNRTKVEYTLEDYQLKDKSWGKRPKKIGLKPIQREGMEYEFDVFCDMDAQVLTPSKTRCKALNGESFRHPGEDFAKILLDWITDGEPLVQHENQDYLTPSHLPPEKICTIRSIFDAKTQFPEFTETYTVKEGDFCFEYATTGKTIKEDLAWQDIAESQGRAEWHDSQTTPRKKALILWAAHFVKERQVTREKEAAAQKAAAKKLRKEAKEGARSAENDTVKDALSSEWEEMETVHCNAKTQAANARALSEDMAMGTINDYFAAYDAKESSHVVGEICKRLGIRRCKLAKIKDSKDFWAFYDEVLSMSQKSKTHEA